MMKKIFLSIVLALSITCAIQSQTPEMDAYPTSKGLLKIYFIAHGTLMFDFNSIIIHVDPWSKLTDYSKLPKADLIFITHHHGDHYDTLAINQVRKNGTLLVLNSGLEERLTKGEMMRNGDSKIFDGIRVEAFPAYNNTPGRDNYHPKGRDNGYIFNFGNRRVYVAGDTEAIPEMTFLKNIYIAFLPMNQPYTMTPQQVSEAVDMFKPKILYPYHYGETDLEELKSLMAKQTHTELIIKPMK
jgi:L-ascorbate metabolism protein UlaG (beta-lactamase superfamily)